jgi:3-hydroxyacyl-[acyl-carrier-protein] dehydratase
MASGAMTPVLDPEILEQIRTILRRDIRLSADDPLPPDARLFGGKMDLDSLDMLLLITSIERQFKIRIPNRAVGEEAFQSVASLVRFVQEQHGKESVISGSHPATGPTDWLAQLPHGKAFRFISRVVEARPGEMASGVWNLDGTEAFFAAHFPGNPVVPGVLIIEALAQISGLAAAGGNSRGGRLAHVDVRFEQPVTPPAEIELESKIVRVLGSLHRCEVVARVGMNVVAKGTITLHRDDGGNG